MRKVTSILAALAAALLCMVPFLLFQACHPRDNLDPVETIADTPGPTLVPHTSAAPDLIVGGDSGWSEGDLPEETAPSYGLAPDADLAPYPDGAAGDGYSQQLARLQRADGSIGTVSLPRTGLYAPIYEGTDTQAMVQGAGHWTGSSLGGGNVCLFGHNRGNNPWFEELLNTQRGDLITLETNAGTRTYRVTQIEQISSQDFTWLGSTGDSVITLISCVQDHPELRLAVRGEEVQA